MKKESAGKRREGMMGWRGGRNGLTRRGCVAVCRDGKGQRGARCVNTRGRKRERRGSECKDWKEEMGRERMNI